MMSAISTFLNQVSFDNCIQSICSQVTKITFEEMEVFDNDHYANFEYVQHGNDPEDLMVSFY